MMISTMRCGGNAAPDCVLRPHQCKKMGFIDDARPLRASVAGLCPSIVAVLRGSGRDAFPTVLGSRLRLNSSKSSRYLQGWSLHALNPKLEHSCQLGCSPNPSPALSVAAGLLKWSRKGRTSWLLFPLQQGGLPITAQAKDNNAARQAVESHCSNQALPELSQETTGLRSGDVGKAIVRAVLLSVAVASTACLAWAGVTDAVGTRTMLLPSVVQQSKDIITTFWPKATQVLGVFRDQGLLLSVLLGLSAFFSMAETAITTLWPWKVRELAEKETEGGVFQLLRQDVTRFLTTILIGTTVANIAATALVTDAATALFGEAGVSAATGVMTVVILLLTEITPKSIAVHNATDVARFVVRPVAWLSYVLYPVGRVVTSISMSMLKFLGLKSSGEPFVTEEELKLMLRGAELSGAIEEEEQDMIENVLEIKDTYVREVMTPLVDVVAIDAGATLMDFRKLWVTHQYSRVPVFERRVDNIVGVAFAMDMLDYVEQTELLQKLTVGRIAHRPAYFVPDSMSVWNLLREFRIRKVHMAIVLNEYGGSVGVVTLEDVVEEIVGEIFDENDSKEEIRRKTGYVVQRADGVYDVDANTSIEDLSEALDTKVPEEPYHYETVSGFVCEAFGYIPRTGESINVILQKEDPEEGSDHREGEADYQEDRRDKYQKYRLEILAGNARKVGSVRFERLESTESKDGETATKVVPRVLRRRRENQKALEEYKAAKDTGGWDVSWNANTDSSNQPVSEDEDTCVVVEERPSTQYLIAESIDVDSVSESDSCVTNGVTVGTEDGDMDAMEKKKTCETGTKDIDIGTAATVEILHEKWEQHEKFIERRRLRRRKQTVEATFELEKQRNTDAREREPEIPRMMLRKRHDFDTQQEQSCNNNEA